MCTGALVSTAPAVSLKVRVTGGIEGPQGEPSHSRLWVLGGLWAGKSSGVRLGVCVTLTQRVY